MVRVVIKTPRSYLVYQATSQYLLSTFFLESIFGFFFVPHILLKFYLFHNLQLIVLGNAGSLMSLSTRKLQSLDNYWLLKKNDFIRTKGLGLEKLIVATSTFTFDLYPAIFRTKELPVLFFDHFFVIWGQLAKIGQLWSILLAHLVSYLHCKARICPGSFICTFLNCNWSLKIVSVVDIIPRRKCNLRTSLFCYVVKYLTDECTFSISYAHDDNTRERVRKQLLLWLFSFSLVPYVFDFVSLKICNNF